MIFLLQPSEPLNSKQEQVLRSIYDASPRIINSASGIKYTVKIKLRKPTKSTIRDIQYLLSEIGSPVQVTPFV